MKRHASGLFEDAEQMCEVCHQSYKSKRDLSRHFRRMHGTNTSYTCQYCGKFFSRKSDGQVHERKVHRLLVEHDKDFKCRFCVRGFDTAKFRELHEQNHQRGELNCKNCGKEYYYRAQCKSHEMICGAGAAGDDLYTCDYCNKTMARKGSLLPHFATHFSIFTFFCELCGKSYKRKEALKRHLVALHSEERDSLIQCEVCAKILSSMTALKRHHKQTHDIGRKIPEKEVKSYLKQESHVNLDERTTEGTIVPVQGESEVFIVEEQDVAQTIEVYSFMIVP